MGLKSFWIIVTNKFDADAPVRIHAWTPDDIASVRHIALTTWLATFSSFIPETDIRLFYDEWYSVEKLTGLCNAPMAKGFIAVVDTQAVGFARTSYNQNEKKFYVHSLYVLPEGQGKGIGTKLLDAAEQFARTFSADGIWLGVMTKNVTALSWYKRIGFQFDREEPFAMGKTVVQHLIGLRKIKL